MVLPDNVRAIRLLRKNGFAIRRMEDGTLRATLNLRGLSKK